MKTLEETYAIIEGLNEEAHGMAWDTWIEADELADSDDEDDWELAEGKREEASDEQAGYFRDEFECLIDEDREAIEHWLTADESFREEFRDWYGRDEFDEKYNGEEYDDA
jgi:hypothetical protein